jgi:hypothetical protein
MTLLCPIIACVIENKAIAYGPALPGGAVTHGADIATSLDALNALLRTHGAAGWRIVGSSSVADGGVLVFLTRETP